jgi:hypothetical protein
MRRFAGLMMLFAGASALLYATGPAAVPEITTASGAGAIALLSGALLVIRGRRKR